MANLFGNNIKTPSQEFVNKFAELTGIYLMASNSRWYHHMLTAMSQKFSPNITKIDDYFGEQDEEYDNNESTYKGKKCSMAGYMTKKFGEDAADMMEYLLDGKFDKEWKGLKEKV